MRKRGAGDAVARTAPRHAALLRAVFLDDMPAFYYLKAGVRGGGERGCFVSELHAPSTAVIALQGHAGGSETPLRIAPIWLGGCTSGEAPGRADGAGI